MKQIVKPCFVQLNKGWNAEPNVPEPTVTADGGVVRLRFGLNSYVYKARPGERAQLTFTDCAKWRLGPVNDEGWYLGQCRYSGVAPKWGEFFELTGEDPRRDEPSDWVYTTVGSGSRHFLFYLRDETFECLASDWSSDKGHS